MAKVQNQRRMLAALEKANGIVTHAARTAKLSRELHYRWLESDPDYKARVKELENVQLDFVESQHFKNIKAGKEASCIFHLKTKGRERGYIERAELGLPPGVTASIIVLPNGREVQI